LYEFPKNYGSVGFVRYFGDKVVFVYDFRQIMLFDTTKKAIERQIGRHRSDIAALTVVNLKSFRLRHIVNGLNRDFN